MKYIKKFEDNKKEYVIITYGKQGLAIAINTPTNVFHPSFRYLKDVKDVKDNTIKTYTLEEAEKEITKFDIEYNHMYTFRCVPLEEFELMIYTDKFNI